jgi:hypothetical protein
MMIYDHKNLKKINKIKIKFKIFNLILPKNLPNFHWKIICVCVVKSKKNIQN